MCISFIGKVLHFCYDAVFDCDRVIIQKMWIVMGKKCLIAILFTCKKNKYLSCLIRTLKQCRRLRKKLPNLNSNLLLRKAHCVWWLLFKNKMLTLDDVLFYHYYQNYVAYSTKYTYRNKNYNLLTNTKDIQGHTQKWSESRPGKEKGWGWGLQFEYTKMCADRSIHV